MTFGYALLICTILLLLARATAQTRTAVWRVAQRAAIAAVVLAAVWGLVLIYYGYQENVKTAARQEWEWQHYTGWRLTMSPLGSTDQMHGIWDDHETGKQCSDKKYPGYPACPANGYFVNGKPAPEPVDLSAGLVPKETLGSPIPMPPGLTPGPPVQKSIWIYVDPYEQYGGHFAKTPVIPDAITQAPKPPKGFTAAQCVPGEKTWGTDGTEWVCVQPETKPEGLPQGAIVGVR